MSKSGVGIKCREPLEVGAMVVLVITTTVVSGQVRWCRNDGDGTFAAGILAKRVGIVE